MGFKKGRGGASQSCITVYDDVPSKDIERKLQSKAEDYPKLVIFLMDNYNVESINITGDGHTFDVTDMGVPCAVLLLCASYYVFDMAFPRKYNQFLGLIQHKIIGEKYVGKRSVKFTELLSKELSDDRDYAVYSEKMYKNVQKHVGAKEKVSGNLLDSDVDDDDTIVTHEQESENPHERIRKKSTTIELPASTSKVVYSDGPSDKGNKYEGKGLTASRKRNSQVLSDSEEDGNEEAMTVAESEIEYQSQREKIKKSVDTTKKGNKGKNKEESVIKRSKVGRKGLIGQKVLTDSEDDESGTSHDESDDTAVVYKKVKGSSVATKGKRTRYPNKKYES